MSTPALLAELRRQMESGLSMHRLGKLGLAESHYARVVKLDPAQAEAWHLLGVVAYQSGNPAKAIKHYRKAVEIRPGFAQAWNNLAIALKARGDMTGATEAFAQALASRPEYAEAAFNLALLHEDAGRVAQAETAYRQALLWDGQNISTLTNLGNLLARSQRAGEGHELLARAHDLSPCASSAGNLSVALLELGRYAQARELASAAVAGEPEASTWWSVLGSATRLLGDLDAALPALRRACDLEPGNAMAHFELGLALAATGDDSGARAATERARELAPALEPIRWGAALLLPSVVGGAAEIDAALDRFSAGIDHLSARLLDNSVGEPAALIEAVAGANSYHVHYLPRDATGLQNRFGDLLVGAMAHALPDLARPVDWRALGHGGRIRVGFVSAFFSRHTVSRYFNAFVTGLDREKFERFVWHTGEAVDEVAQGIASAVDHFEHVHDAPHALAARIRAAQLDVLVFPDVGMDPRQNVYAALRLASLQIALYGHPVTTGLPTVDAFLSGDLLEPEAAQSHYRERLIRLPGLGAGLVRPTVAPDRAWFDALGDGRPTLLCVQNLSKLTIDFDRAAAKILAGSEARLMFFDRGPALTRRYLARLASVCAEAGVSFEAAVTVLPARPYPEFLGAIAAADLVLDSPWFSGGATSLDAFAVGAPVLAWESPMARGRQTSAMLRAMDLPQLIAHDADEYVETALRLLREPEERTRLRDAIGARSGVLFDSAPVVAAFASFIEAEARSCSGRP